MKNHVIAALVAVGVAFGGSALVSSEAQAQARTDRAATEAPARLSTPATAAQLASVHKKCEEMASLDDAKLCAAFISVLKSGKLEGASAASEITTFMGSLEEGEGGLRINRKKLPLHSWTHVTVVHSRASTGGVVKRRTKGGFVVDISGIEAY